MDYNFVSAAVLLFLVIDPLGNIPLFSSVLKDIPIKRRKVIVLRESVFFNLFYFSLAFLSFLDFLAIFAKNRFRLSSQCALKPSVSYVLLP